MRIEADVERDLVIVACAVSAGIHAALVPAHGASFAVAAAALGCGALAVTGRAGVLELAGAAAILAGSLAAYAVAVGWGLPLVHPEREAVEPLAVFTKAVELAGLGAALHLVRRALPAVRPIPLGLTTLIGVFSALAALASTGGHTHGA